MGQRSEITGWNGIRSSRSLTTTSTRPRFDSFGHCDRSFPRWPTRNHRRSRSGHHSVDLNGDHRRESPRLCIPSRSRTSLLRERRPDASIGRIRHAPRDHSCAVLSSGSTGSRCKHCNATGQQSRRQGGCQTCTRSRSQQRRSSSDRSNHGQSPDRSESAKG